MSPVCPACRAEVGPVANLCWRCGLAIRPTCAACGEPIVSGSSACRSCFTPVDVPAQATAVTAPIASVPAAAAPPRFYEPPPPEPRSRAGRLFLTGIFAGLFVAVALLVLDGVALRWRYPPADETNLVTRRVASQEVSFRAPARWEAQTSTDNLLLLADPRPGRDRTLLVQTGKTSFASMRKRYTDFNGSRYLDYRQLGVVLTEIDGRDAFRHSFIGDALQHWQIWIDRDDGILRIEFTFHPAEADEALELNRLILESFDIT